MTDVVVMAVGVADATHMLTPDVPMEALVLLAALDLALADITGKGERLVLE